MTHKSSSPHFFRALCPQHAAEENWPLVRAAAFAPEAIMALGISTYTALEAVHILAQLWYVRNIFVP